MGKVDHRTDPFIDASTIPLAMQRLPDLRADECSHGPPSVRCKPNRDDRSNPMPTITPSLWFDTQSMAAAEFYISVFPNSKITNVSHYGEAGPRGAGSILTVDFELDGQPYTAINGGPQFTFDEAISLQISCADQADIDYYWSKLAEGGEEGPCGWLQDRFGLSWQVVPTAAMAELMNDPDKGRSQRAMQAVLGMKKLDVAEIYAAADRV